MRAVDGMATSSMPMRSTALRSIIAARRGAAAQPRRQPTQAAAQQPPGCACAQAKNEPAVVYRSCTVRAHRTSHCGLEDGEPVWEASSIERSSPEPAVHSLKSGVELSPHTGTID